jgi:DNA-directed RNA polymerase II subunit RPB1
MEMNLHMPQDPESEAELKNLAAVPYQIVSPANNSSIIGIYQDSMLGSYLFTRAGMHFSPRDAMNLLMMFDNVNEKQLLEDISKDGGVTNFDILSQIMPPLSMKQKHLKMIKMIRKHPIMLLKLETVNIFADKWIKAY